MTLHLLKLCVGSDSVEDLEEWIAFRLAEKGREGRPAEHAHVTRMTPKRAGEIVVGGSLYWVVKGNVQCRQRVVAIRPFIDAEGVGRCQIVLDPRVVRTQWQPRRAFQGWRYLKASEAPQDVRADAAGRHALPQALRLELAELGLL